MFNQACLLYLELSNHTNYLNLIFSFNGWISNFVVLVFIFFVFKKSGYKLKLSCFTISFFTYSSSDVLFCYAPLKGLIASLWVGTINIHPVLFYLAIILAFQKLLNTGSSSALHIVTINFRYLAVLGILSLLLGGLWGLQSLAWGYLWVDDGIEWTLLLLCIYVVYLFHKISREYTVTALVIVPVILIIFLLAIRLGVVPTRHSFFLIQQILYPTIIFYYTLFFSICTPNYFIKVPLFIKSNKMVFSIFLVFVLTLPISIFLKYFLLYTFYFFFKKTLSLTIKVVNFFNHFFIFLTGVVWGCGFFFYILQFQIYLHVESSLNLYPKVYQLSQSKYISEDFIMQTLESMTFIVDRLLFNYFNVIGFIYYFISLTAGVFIMLSLISLNLLFL